MIRLTVPLHWHRSINFGDQCAPYLIEKMTGRKCSYVWLDDKLTNLIVIGSLLTDQLLHHSIVWGCGFAFEPDNVVKPLAIHAVRGKLSKDIYDRNKIPCPSVFGDPAILKKDVAIWWRKRYGSGCKETLRVRYKELTDGN